MTLKNFRAVDFKRDGSSVKIAHSTRDVFDAPVVTTKPIIAANANPEDVPSGTVPEVLTWVGDDAVRAQKALDAELADSKPRKGLVAQLSDLINAEAEEAEESKTEEDAE